MLTEFAAQTGTFLLLAFPALFSIINPLGGAFIFLAATRGMEQAARSRLARQVAIYSFITLNVSMLIGAFVLRIFGIDMPVLRLAGGIIIALTAWKLLNAEDDSAQRGAVLEEAGTRDASHLAFYPLTMPMTTGPGTIAVAVAEPDGEVRSLGAIPNRAEALRRLIKRLGLFGDKAVPPTGSPLDVLWDRRRSPGYWWVRPFSCSSTRWAAIQRDRSSGLITTAPS